jgi:hypothetical protein
MRFSIPRPLSVALALLALAGFGSRLTAATVDDSYTLNLPLSSTVVLPNWLGQPVIPAGTFASMDRPLTAPAINDSLLVTIIFQEKEGGFLRLTWKNAEGEQLLTSNFYEGVDMANKRSLLIPSSVVRDMGTLSLQCGDTSLDVQKIHFEWLQGSAALVSPEQTDQVVVSRLGSVAKASTLDGQPAGVPVSDIDGDLITVPISNSPERIEQGVQFSLQLEGSPKAARLSFQESGLPWGQHLVVWLNQQRAATVSPVVPDLEETGFAAPPDATQPFIGWREVSAYLPVSLMKAGLNTLQISTESDTDSADTSDADATSTLPLAVNNLSCQFDYTAAVAATSTAPTTAAAATVSPTNAVTATPASTAAPTAPVTDSPATPAETTPAPAAPDATTTKPTPSSPSPSTTPKAASIPDFLNTTVP